MRLQHLCPIVMLLAMAGCQVSATPSTTREVTWHSLGSWSGAGRTQTESFTSNTGTLRVRWKTTVAADRAPGAFQVTINSAISGRPLSVAVDHEGAGSDTAYVTEDPRVFFAVVESAGLDWAFTVEEAVSR